MTRLDSSAMMMPAARERSVSRTTAIAAIQCSGSVAAA
jgi:hypothetical protein